MRIATTTGSHSRPSSNRLNKTLLATAVASACTLPALAQAQTQVLPGLTIYGRVNVSYERITTKDSSDTTAQPNQSNLDVVDNSSRVGFRGRKELTPGLFGHFQIESRVRLDNGGDTFSSRDSYAGLEGSWGNARLGRTIGPVYYATYDYISMHNHDTGTSADALLAPTIFGNQGFMNNTLWYTSPKFGAFSVDAVYSLLSGTTSNPTPRVNGMSQQSYIGLVGAYDQGPMHLAVSYAQTKNDRDLDEPGPGTSGSDDKAYTIGGLYNFKSFVVGALFERAESKLLVGDVSRNYFRISAMMPVGKHEFHVNIGSVNGRLDADLSDDGAKQWTLAYNYNITKETKVYAFYTTVDNDPNGNYGGAVFGPNQGVVAVTNGLNIQSIAVGVRHNF
jgi:predicted porin